MSFRMPFDPGLSDEIPAELEQQPTIESEIKEEKLPPFLNRPLARIRRSEPFNVDLSAVQTGVTPSYTPTQSDLLETAQRAAAATNLAANLGMAGTAIAEGAGAKVSPAAFKTIGQQAEQPLELIKQNQRQQKVQAALAEEAAKKDPRSAASTIARALAESFGITNIPDTVTASQIESVMPIAYKAYEASLGRQSREDIAEQNRLAKQEAKDTQLYQFQTKRLDDLKKKLTEELASGRTTVLGRSANTVRSAEAIEGLLDRIGDPNKITTQEMQEIARALDGMLSVGQPSVSGMNKLVPTSLRGDISKIVQYISNIPTGTAQGDFVSRFRKTIKTEKQIAENQIQRAKNKLVAGTDDIKKAMPTAYEEVINATMRDASADPRVPQGYTPEQPSTVRIRDPKGVIRDIPSNMVDKALKAGGTLVQ